MDQNVKAVIKRLTRGGGDFWVLSQYLESELEKHTKILMTSRDEIVIKRSQGVSIFLQEIIEQVKESQ